MADWPDVREPEHNVLAHQIHDLLVQQQAKKAAKVAELHKSPVLPSWRKKVPGPPPGPPAEHMLKQGTAPLPAQIKAEQVSDRPQKTARRLYIVTPGSSSNSSSMGGGKIEVKPKPPSAAAMAKARTSAKEEAEAKASAKDEAKATAKTSVKEEAKAMAKTSVKEEASQRQEAMAEAKTNAKEE